MEIWNLIQGQINLCSFFFFCINSFVKCDCKFLAVHMALGYS